MPKPDLEVPVPANCVGYGCVVVPDVNEYQGFFINDNEDVRREVNTIMLFAMASGAHPIGALQAVCVDAVLKKDWPQLAVASLALSNITKERFFWIKASKEPGGTRTEMFPLNARTIADAKVEIDGLQDVIDLKRRLLEQLRGNRQ